MQVEHLSLHPDLLSPLAQLHHAEWGLPYESVASRAERIGSVVGHPGSIPSVYVALLDSELCGSVALLAFDRESRYISPWLSGLFVKPELRNRGVGRALVHAAVAEARAMGALTLHLDCEPHLQAFYERLGWRVVQVSPNLVVMSCGAVA